MSRKRNFQIWLDKLNKLNYNRGYKATNSWVNHEFTKKQGENKAVKSKGENMSIRIEINDLIPVGAGDCVMKDVTVCASNV
jgi:hypothetical protein